MEYMSEFQYNKDEVMIMEKNNLYVRFIITSSLVSKSKHLRNLEVLILNQLIYNM